MEAKKIKLPFNIRTPILALGSQGKNTICFARGRFACLSHPLDNLDRPESLLIFIKQAKYFLRKKPRVIVCDLHPEYQSTKFAFSLPASLIHRQVQHHHAHLASCMVDNNLGNDKLIGVAFDGTGLGDDGTLWGAEFLICNYSGYLRKAHLGYIPLAGAEKAIWQPWRVAIFLLYFTYKDRMFDLNIDFMKKIDKRKWMILNQMYCNNFNSPPTSSMGRLFDAVASLVLIKFDVRSEAEATIEFEKKAARFIQHTHSQELNKIKAYNFKILLKAGKYIIGTETLVSGIVCDIINRRSREEIAYKFHYSVAQMIRKVCLLLRKETKIKKVILSGGVFQNKVLLSLVLNALEKKDFQVFHPRSLSCSDSSISLGQMSVANFKGN